ncbi:MAG: hypothetical protein BGN83_21810 [Rhizobium sp. 63-7]|nr:MAG: hypothetical protein BGN83_21810 [Rhizobium sp. 63-7]
MVSTYLSYDLVNRDIRASLKRVEQEQQVAREAAYYKANIGSVKTVDEFLKNDRLYNYAMTAYGLEDMIYAKAFMRQVLESDLTDSNSYANRLTDERYKDFAAAFSFASNAPVAQSSVQIDEIIGLYTSTIERTDASMHEETAYYNAMMDHITSADDILNNDRLRAYMFTTFGIDESNYARVTIRGALMSDLNDPNSYINTVWGPRLAQYQSENDAANTQIATLTTSYQADMAERADYIAQLEDPGADENYILAQITTIETRMAQSYQTMSVLSNQVESNSRSISEIGKYYDIAAAYNFNADGSVPAGQGAQSDEMKKLTNEQYILANPRVTSSAALLNKEYFEQKVAAATNVNDLFADPFDERIYNYIKTAFGLTSAVVLPSTIENILTSDRDPDNPSSYINLSGTNKQTYKALMEAFNFNQDGSLDAGVPAQSETQMQLVSNYYMSAYNDKDDAADEKAITQYKKDIEAITSVAQFMAKASVYEFALKAVGLNPDKVSSLTIKNVLKSDLNDPKSYVYQLKDERYVKLAKAFNFDTKGQIVEPLTAQSPAVVTQNSKDYIVLKTRFVASGEVAAVRKKAEEEAQYYADNIGKIDNVKELLADRKILDVVLFSKGIDPAKVTDEDLKKMFESDLDDPKSYVNGLADWRFAEVVASFNFNAAGNLIQSAQDGIQQRGEVLETANRYLNQVLETEQGEENAGVRLALYFKRMADSITSAYDILGDTALLEVFRTMFSLPTELSNMDIDQQAKIVEKNLDLSELKDPEALEKLVKRFTILYDLENGVNNAPSLAILLGDGGSATINGDTLMAIAQLRKG